MTTSEQADVVVVGGGPAGAVLAARVARAGRAVVVLERMAEWGWHAGGVFTSPATLTALRRVGLHETTIRTVARPIPAMRVETPAGTTFRLTYGAEAGGECAVGFDRSRLDPALLALATTAGADVRLGWAVTSVDPASGLVEARTHDGVTRHLVARVIVGADGPRSVVATAPGWTLRDRPTSRRGSA